MRPSTLAIVFALALLQSKIPAASAASFGDDTAFLRKYTEVIVLSDATGAAQVAIAPAWQGRVMTSTAAGDQGRSFGWVNRELIASGERQPHINVFGGEDRFWLGPEGGQFSIFFARGVPFDFKHWFVPAALDTEPFKLVSHSRDRAAFEAHFSLTNYSGTRFDVGVEREVRLVEPKRTLADLNVSPPEKIALVAFESVNTLINAGTAPWRKDSGLLSIWILGMFNPSPSATIVVPIERGPDRELGSKVTSDYFGEIPANRLKVTERAIFFSGDGQYRSKIGINPQRALGRLGSYDAEHRVLTLVLFDQPKGATDYVNSLWKLQQNPYAGDAANSYNDGPATPGAKPLGPFYELESSSPAAALGPGERLTHIHRTVHVIGPDRALDAIARPVLGVSLAEIQSALPR